MGFLFLAMMGHCLFVPASFRNAHKDAYWKGEKKKRKGLAANDSPPEVVCTLDEAAQVGTALSEVLDPLTNLLEVQVHVADLAECVVCRQVHLLRHDEL